jgi:hypothetical protein
MRSLINYFWPLFRLRDGVQCAVLYNIWMCITLTAKLKAKARSGTFVFQPLPSAGLIMLTVLDRK